MIMCLGGGIEPFLRSAHLDLEDHATVSHQFEIAIDRTQSDAGQPFSDHVVKFAGGWVGLDLSQFFKNDMALGGKPNHRCGSVHGVSYHRNANN